jgi:oligosaccharide repeat unit polymerase
MSQKKAKSHAGSTADFGDAFSPCSVDSFAVLGAAVCIVLAGLMFYFSKIASILYVVSYAGIVATICRPKKFVDIFRFDVFLMIAFGVYTIPVVAFDAIDAQSNIVTNRDSFGKYLMLTTLFLLATTLSFSAFSGRSIAGFQRLRQWGDGWSSERITAIIMAISTGAICLIFVPFLFGGYTSIATTARGDLQVQSPIVGLFGAFYYVMIFSIIFLVSCSRSRKDWLFLFALALLIANVGFFSITGDRKFMVFLLVGLSIHFVRRRYIKPFQLLFLVFIAFFVLNAFRKVRDVRGDLPDYLDHVRDNFELDWFSLRDSEFGGHFMVSDFVLSEGDEEPLLGFSYLAGVMNLVPRIIWRDEKYVSLAVSFAERFDREYAAKGGGFAYSFVLESYQNFLLVGPLMVGLFMGAALGRTYLSLVRLGSAFSWAMYAVVIGLLVIVPRTEFATLVKLAFASCIVPLVLYFFSKKFLSVVFRRE